MATTPDPKSVDAFLDEIEGMRDQAVRDIFDGRYGRPPFGSGPTTEARLRPEVIFLMQLGLYPEWRESHFLARQLQRLDDIQLVYRVGKQIADETKHAKVLHDQLSLWGADPVAFWEQPIYQWSAAFDYMDKLSHPAEYFACSNFVGEGLFLPTIMAPMQKYEKEAFAVYIEHIIPDEHSHVLIGRDVILKYCHTFEMQSRVRNAASRLVKLYCIGYEAAMKFAWAAKQGLDPAVLRDGEVVLPALAGQGAVVA